jgi:hypothetical protein
MLSKKRKILKRRTYNAMEMGETKKEDGDGKKTGKDSAALLRKKISYLEEELVRKEKIIDQLKEENIILFKTALKNSENKAESDSKNKKERQ